MKDKDVNYFFCRFVPKKDVIFIPYTGFIALFLLFSCTEKSVSEVTQSVGSSWHRDSIVSFDFEVSDTIATYDLFLKLKINKDYPFSNIFVIASIENPSEQIQIDTLEYIMADPDGKILGNGFSAAKHSKLWLKQNYRFSQLGIHTIKVEQAMRKRGEIEGLEQLEGVSKVGLRVEKSPINIR